MSNFESEDLLLKSQMLISKFRKQREMALSQQSLYINKPMHVKKYVSNTNNFNAKKSQKDCDSYPQRERDNILSNRFMNQHYFTQSIEESKLKTPKDYIHDASENMELGSSSDSSIWSASSPTEIGVKKIDCGVMTEIVLNDPVYDDEAMTSVTTFRPSCRTARGTHSTSSRHFSSICTQFQNKETSHEDTVIHAYRDTPREILVEETPPILSFVDGKHESNEEDQMKAAWEYFQEEKVLERRISQQNSLVDELQREMNTLMAKIESESRKLKEMENDKEQFRSRRYGIFNGLSKEKKTHVDERPESSPASNLAKQNENNSFMRHAVENNSEETDVDLADKVSPLDSDTIRNIVNKIVSKEFCNSEDKIFDKVLTNSRRTYLDNQLPYSAPDDNLDDCVLSDVLSFKDLKITSPSLDNTTTKTSVNTRNSSISIFNNSVKTIESKPPKSKETLKPAHSADNIHQMVTDRKYRRKKHVRSPSISVDLKRYLYSSSSSDDSMFESTMHSRR